VKKIDCGTSQRSGASTQERLRPFLQNLRGVASSECLELDSLPETLAPSLKSLSEVKDFHLQEKK
jgi:hypothetical protein